MIFPFVSRSQHEAVVEQLEQRLAEQKELNKNLMAYIGIVPREQASEPEQAVTEAADPIAPFIGRRRRLSSVVHEAEKKLLTNFKEKYPITSELDELEAQGRALAHGS